MYAGYIMFVKNITGYDMMSTELELGFYVSKLFSKYVTCIEY